MSVERIQQHFRDSAAVKLEALETLSMPIAAAIDTLFAALANGSRILACGNGGSAAGAQQFAAELIKSKIGKLRELSPLWEMFKDGIDLNSIEWAAH